MKTKQSKIVTSMKLPYLVTWCSVFVITTGVRDAGLVYSSVINIYIAPQLRPMADINHSVYNLVVL